eukprot:Amastigsp_a6848_31.p2 type:complete len:156 gc:universal Amastigsp_a6848_31:151-618(+)
MASWRLQDTALTLQEPRSRSMARARLCAARRTRSGAPLSRPQGPSPHAQPQSSCCRARLCAKAPPYARIHRSGSRRTRWRRLGSQTRCAPPTPQTSSHRPARGAVSSACTPSLRPQSRRAGARPLCSCSRRARRGPGSRSGRKPFCSSSRRGEPR